MVNSEIPHEWMVKADEDFDFALINLEEGNNFYAQICFHFQQAAEKYLKTYIVAYKLLFKKIHDLEDLLKICLEHNSSFSQLGEDCIFLTDYYIDTRYPVHWPAAISNEEAQNAKEAAERIRNFVKEKLLRI
jgi:HEPN domain-containing protein